MGALHSGSIRRAAALVLLPCYLVACHRWVPAEEPAPAVVAEGKRTLRVTLADSTRLTLEQVRLEGDSLIGTQRIGTPPVQVTKAVALADIARVETSQLKAAATAVTVVGVIAAAGLVAIAIAVAAWEGPYAASCPLVYSWNGSEWTLESGIFPSSLSPIANHPSTDVLSFATPTDGKLRLRLTNELNEIDYTDRIMVLAVDHSPAASLVADPAGRLHTVRELDPPIAARDRRGLNALPRIAREDDWRWESNPTGRDSSRLADLEDALRLTFVRPPGAASAKLVVSGRQTSWTGTLLREFVSAHGSATRAWYDSIDASPVALARVDTALGRVGAMQVAVRERGGWRVQGRLADAGPEVDRRQAVPIDLTRVEGDTVRIELRSTPSIWVVDQVAIDYSADEPMAVAELPLVAAVTDEGRSATRELRRRDGAYLRQAQGEGATLTFADRPATARAARTYVLHSAGWYRLVTPESGAPRTDVLTRFMEDPTAGRRMAIGRLADALAGLERAARPVDARKPNP